MEKLKVGIIGCGGIANGKHMPALKKLGNVAAKVYTDYKELLKDESIHHIRVCTPNRWHAFKLAEV